MIMPSYSCLLRPCSGPLAMIPRVWTSSRESLPAGNSWCLMACKVPAHWPMATTPRVGMITEDHESHLAGTRDLCVSHCVMSRDLPAFWPIGHPTQSWTSSNETRSHICLGTHDLWQSRTVIPCLLIPIPGPSAMAPRVLTSLQETANHFRLATHILSQSRNVMSCLVSTHFLAHRQQSTELTSSEDLHSFCGPSAASPGVDIIKKPENPVPARHSRCL